jgi:hypothetical protein
MTKPDYASMEFKSAPSKMVYELGGNSNLALNLFSV